MITELLPSQLARFAEKVELSDCLIVIVYFVIGEPLAKGATHPITTFVP